uniref:Uncharacterized protein n=2 Tax=Oryza meridionalis TaxID=40149 RepID=A0A0E0EUN1_9ORYZ
MKGKEATRRHGSLAMGAEGRESGRVGDDPALRPAGAGGAAACTGIRLWDETTGEKRVIVLRRLGMAATSCNPWDARVRVLTLGPEFVRLVPPVGLFYIGIMGKFQKLALASHQPARATQEVLSSAPPSAVLEHQASSEMNCIQESSLSGSSSASASAPPEVDPTGTSGGDGVSYCSWPPPPLLASSCWQAPSSSAMLHCPCSSSTSVQIAFFLKTRHNAGTPIT